MPAAPIPDNPRRVGQREWLWASGLRQARSRVPKCRNSKTKVKRSEKNTWEFPEIQTVVFPEIRKTTFGKSKNPRILSLDFWPQLVESGTTSHFQTLDFHLCLILGLWIWECLELGLWGFPVNTIWCVLRSSRNPLILKNKKMPEIKQLRKSDKSKVLEAVAFILSARLIDREETVREQQKKYRQQKEQKDLFCIGKESKQNWIWRVGPHSRVGPQAVRTAGKLATGFTPGELAELPSNTLLTDYMLSWVFPFLKIMTSQTKWSWWWNHLSLLFIFIEFLFVCFGDKHTTAFPLHCSAWIWFWTRNIREES